MVSFGFEKLTYLQFISDPSRPSPPPLIRLDRIRCCLLDYHGGPLLLSLGHRLADLSADGAPHRGRHGVSDLPVLVQNRPAELVRVRESLGASALPHRDEAVLLRVKHAALLPHGLGVGHRRGEVAVVREPAVEARPLVVPVGGVRQAPRDQRVALLVPGVATEALLPVLAGADAALDPLLGTARLEVVVSVISGVINDINMLSITYHAL